MADKNINDCGRGRKNVKLAVTVMAVVLVLGTVIGGTLAWLMDRTTPVVNTFTYGDIDITLVETDTGDGDNNPNTNRYEMVPGTDVTKDPVVTVQADSLDSWLFVKLEKSANYDSFMEFEIASGWTQLTGQEGVYYRETSRSDADQSFQVLKDNKVSVKDTVTKAMLNALDEGGASDYPTLTITSYAVQKAGVETVNDAWSIASGL